MTYAIISDIHGNYPALKAVLNDAEANNAERYLFLGDYTNSFPFQNEVVNTIRSLPDTIIISGNHEDGMKKIHETPPQNRTSPQFMPMYWSYNRHTPENIKFLLNLPATADTEDGLHLSHEMDLFRFSPELPHFNPSGYAQLKKASPFTFEEYLVNAREALLAQTGSESAIHALPEGVYLFGHSHIAFNMEYDGRVFINPGSCGFACDHDTRAAYVLLTLNPGSGPSIRQRRVAYDMNEVTAAMLHSGFADKMPAWNKVFSEQFLKAEDAFLRFVSDIGGEARKRGETEASEEAFRAAADRLG